MKVAIDLCGRDALGPGHGQYRFCISLIENLANLNNDYHFIVIGSGAEPPQEIGDLFKSTSGKWSYETYRELTCRGAYLLEYLRFPWFLYRHQVDLCHSLEPKAKLFGKHIQVATIHDLFYEKFDEYKEARNSKPYKLFKKILAWKRNTFVVCSSHATNNDLKKYVGLPECLVDVIHLGTNINNKSHFTNLKKRIKEKDKDKFIILGQFTLEPRKGLLNCLESISRLRHKNYVSVDFEIRLFGKSINNSEKRIDEFNRKCDELDLSKNIRLLGLVDDSKLAEEFQKADLFVFPSKYEGFGYPVLEAMSHGCCVLTSNISSLPEIIGDCGFLVDPNSIDDITSGLEKAWNNEHLREKYSLEGYERSKQFKPDEMARKYLDLYGKLLVS